MKIASVLAASCCAALNTCMGKGAHVSANFSNMPDETMCMEVYTLCDNTVRTVLSKLMCLNTTHMLYLPVIFSSI